jgi:hypothetical protein
MQAITTIGLDIAKSVFQVHGVDEKGNVILRRQLKGRYVLAFFQKLPPCLVGIEACGSSHRLSAAELEQVIKLVGRSPRLYPPGTLDALKQRKTLVSPPPSDSVPSNISAKNQVGRPQHSADRMHRMHPRASTGLGGSPSPA